MNTVYFYAPDPSTHYLFEQDSQKWMGVSNNFTFWIVRTYLCLQKAGFPCEVVDYMPERGIVIADRDTLGNKYPYLPKTMLICAKGDREFHPSAYLHVVQNPTELDSSASSLWNPYYILPWPQPNLIPRLAERGAKVENVAFIGTRNNLTQELLSERWLNALSKLGCNWYPVFNNNRWNDYQNLDVVVAVRSFDNNPYTHKPASKLINCWRASTPAVLTPESAYVSLKKSELDFLDIKCLDGLIESIRELKEDSELYLSMIENGKLRSQEFTEEKITQDWIVFFNEYVFERYEEWLKMSDLTKRCLFLKRYFQLRKNRLEQRIKK